MTKISQFLKRVNLLVLHVTLRLTSAWISLQLNARRAKRLVHRFAKRFVEIWYIGAFVLLSIIALEYTSMEFQLSSTLHGYISSLINIAITVYAIDFLRTEYDRKRDANRRYLMDVEVFNCALSALQIIDFTFTGHSFRFINEDGSPDKFEILSLSSVDLDALVANQAFWDTEALNSSTRRQLLVATLNKLQNNLTHLTYTGFLPYSTYRLTSPVIGYCDGLISDIRQSGNTNDPLIAGGTSLTLTWLVESLYKMFQLLDYWHKDEDLELKLQRIRTQLADMTHS